MLFIVIFWYLEYEYVEILQVTLKTIWKKNQSNAFFERIFDFSSNKGGQGQYI